MESEFWQGLLMLTAERHLFGCPGLPSGGEGWAKGRGEYRFYLPNALFGAVLLCLFLLLQLVSLRERTSAG